MHKRLTDSLIASLDAGPNHSRVEVADAGCSGLWLRISGAGVKSFAVRYRVNGRPARYTIGRYPSVSLKKARTTAVELFDRIRKGEDPRHRKWDAKTIGKYVTVEFVLTDYLEKLGRRNRGRRLRDSHIAEVKRRFLAEVLPAIGARSFETVNRDTLVRLLDRLEARAPRVAGHLFYDLRVFYKWAVQQGMIAASPMEGLDPPVKPEPRERVLTNEELGKIWKACCNPGAYHTIIKLLILTAQRRGEVAGSRWSEFELSTGLWTIPKHRTKNGKEHRLPLPKRATEILTEWHSVAGSGPHVFASEGSKRSSFSGFSKSKRRLDELSGVHNWTVHDLRRTTATNLAEMRIPPHVIERVLNHTGGSISPIARVYNRHAYEDEMRDALERWSARLGEILGPASDD